MLIANSSRIHPRQIFSSVQMYLSGAVGSEWWDKERNSLLIWLSSESPDPTSP